MVEDFNKCVEDSLAGVEEAIEDQKTELSLCLASACYAIVYDPRESDPKTEFKGLPWLFSDYLMKCLEVTRPMNPNSYIPVPDSPITEKITKAILRNEDPDLAPISQVYFTLLSWAENEDLCRRFESTDGLHGPRGSPQKNNPLICSHCVYTLYRACKGSSMFGEVMRSSKPFRLSSMP